MTGRPAGVLRLGRRVFEPSQLLIVAGVALEASRDPAVATERVHAVVAEGADVVEVSGPIGRVGPLVAAVRDAYPELAVGVSTGRREVAREACAAGADLLCWGDLGPLGFWGFLLAAEFGAGVVCPVAMAARAVEAGVEPERIVVGADSASGLTGLVATGWPVLVSLSDQDGAASVAGGLAAAAVGAWLGVRLFRVPWIGPTRRVLRMVSAIRGDIPPAHAVRGLALSVVGLAAG
jgi:dihydropteroate synthase